MPLINLSNPDTHTFRHHEQRPNTAAYLPFLAVTHGCPLAITCWITWLPSCSALSACKHRLTVLFLLPRKRTSSPALLIYQVCLFSYNAWFLVCIMLELCHRFSVENTNLHIMQIPLFTAIPLTSLPAVSVAWCHSLRHFHESFFFLWLQSKELSILAIVWHRDGKKKVR